MCVCHPEALKLQAQTNIAQNTFIILSANEQMYGFILGGDGDVHRTFSRSPHSPLN
jgi:hypothetical protein